MRKYFTKLKLLVLLVCVLLVSCSDQETQTQTTVVARPTVPIQNNEVRIGNQIWMTKNLNVSRYRNGDPIPQVTDPTAWANLTTGAWCYSANSTANGTTYGKLYNWYAVNDPRGLAPQGWHVPKDVEWTSLINFLGGQNLAGGALRSTTGWNSPNTGATNSSGFTALPGGNRNGNGPFTIIGILAYWWSSTDTNSGPYLIELGNESPSIFGSSGSFASKNIGMSVRCVKNEVISDIDGNLYRTEVIGTQTWTKSNLNVSQYRNGDIIPQVTDPAEWGNLTTGAWCYNQNDSSNGVLYGKLYNWYAVNDSRGIAPTGWHIPTDDEWTTLTTFLGGLNLAGGKKKATTLWISPNTDATNSSGFTGLPGGNRNSTNLFSAVGYVGGWWSFTQNGTTNAWRRSLDYDDGNAYRISGNKVGGFSLRCLKD